jgi:hypothetical protein
MKVNRERLLKDIELFIESVKNADIDNNKIYLKNLIKHNRIIRLKQLIEKV